MYSLECDFAMLHAEGWIWLHESNGMWTGSPILQEQAAHMRLLLVRHGEHQSLVANLHRRFTFALFIFSSTHKKKNL